MRTTIEITDAQRARLLEMAARRGEKGFSGLVQEAIDHWLAAQRDAAEMERIRKALAVLGTLDDKAADALEASTKAIRRSWR